MSRKEWKMGQIFVVFLQYLNFTRAKSVAESQFTVMLLHFNCIHLLCVIIWIHFSDLAIVDAWALTWINLSNYYIISLMYLWAEGLPHWILWAYASVTHVLSLSLMCGTLNIILLRTILIFRPVHIFIQIRNLIQLRYPDEILQKSTLYLFYGPVPDFTYKFLPKLNLSKTHMDKIRTNSR